MAKITKIIPPEYISLVVTRHSALVEYLIEKGLITDEAKVVKHAEEGDVKGKHVVGVLPLHLAASAASVTAIPLHLPPELRGKELSVEQVRQYAGEPERYVVRNVEDAVCYCETPYWGAQIGDRLDVFDD